MTWQANSTEGRKVSLFRLKKIDKKISVTSMVTHKLQYIHYTPNRKFHLHQIIDEMGATMGGSKKSSKKKKKKKLPKA